MENEFANAYGIWATANGKQVIVTMGKTRHEFELAQQNFPTSEEEGRVWAAYELGVEPGAVVMEEGPISKELVEASV